MERTIAPKGYFDKKIPRSRPEGKEKYYNFIKPTWTKNKALAVTAFQMSHISNKSDKKRMSKESEVVFCNENRILSGKYSKDE